MCLNNKPDKLAVAELALSFRPSTFVQIVATQVGISILRIVYNVALCVTHALPLGTFAITVPKELIR